MVTQVRTTLQQVMDWRAAIWAGLIAGTISLLALLIGYPIVTGGSPWIILRYIAAVPLGKGVLPPPTTFDPGLAAIALIMHFALSVFYALILAFIIHRWGLLVGIVGGALFGLAIYAINFFTFTNFFDWFYPARTWSFAAVHILFGAVAGGVYELLEREVYVMAEE